MAADASWSPPGGTSPAVRALSHVATLAAGPLLPPGARPSVTLNFHPDRPARGVPILRSFAQDGVYRSQFVTGTGNGGLTAHPGGDRWLWESRMFGGAYDDADPHERPVYGALNHRGDQVGGAPRFGSCHFRLTPAILARTTFCYPDSSERPVHFGVADRCAALVEMAVAHGVDLLDGHVEAHVHGSVRLDRDVAALVLDACYRGTPVEDVALRLPCPVEWHDGFRLRVGELRRRRDFRGPRAVEVGARIAEDGWLDPRIIGDASRSGRFHPQELKWVWHVLARFGHPAARRR